MYAACCLAEKEPIFRQRKVREELWKYVQPPANRVSRRYLILNWQVWLVDPSSRGDTVMVIFSSRFLYVAAAIYKMGTPLISKFSNFV